MTQKYSVKRMANITDPNGAESVFYEVWDVFEVDGLEREHRNQDRTFKTAVEAQAWIEEQSGK